MKCTFVFCVALSFAVPAFGQNFSEGWEYPGGTSDPGFASNWAANPAYENIATTWYHFGLQSLQIDNTTYGNMGMTHVLATPVRGTDANPLNLSAYMLVVGASHRQYLDFTLELANGAVVAPATGSANVVAIGRSITLNGQNAQFWVYDGTAWINTGDAISSYSANPPGTTWWRVEITLNSTQMIWKLTQPDGAVYYIDTYTLPVSMQEMYFDRINIRHPGAANATTHRAYLDDVNLLWGCPLTLGVDPAGVATTPPAVGGPYPYALNELVNISATSASADYVFSQWLTDFGSPVASPTSASTTVTMDTTKTVTAAFERVQLTMAVQVDVPAGVTISPALGTSLRTANEVVALSATALAPGYSFDHWEVSAGSSVDSPTSPSTTVTMDRAKTVTAVVVQPTLFQDSFDSYATDAWLSASSSGVWIIGEGTNDGYLGGLAYSAPNGVADWKNLSDQRVGYRNRHNLTASEMGNAFFKSGTGAMATVDGLDSNPLKLEFKLTLGPAGSAYYWWLNGYVELSCGGDRAPTVMDLLTCNQKTRHRLHPTGDGQIHRSIAVGQIAWADPNGCTEYDNMANYRLTVYDGKNWNVLQTPLDVQTCSGANFVTVRIKATTLEIDLSSMNNGTNCGGPRNTKTVVVPRQYSGPFSTIKLGGIPQDPADGTGVWGQDNSPVGAYPSQQTTIDDVRLSGGQASDSPPPCDAGACCLGDHVSCEQLTAAACSALSGAVFKGAETVCGVGAGTCCPAPPDFARADFDYDGDVDMTDFAALQRCVTIGGGSIQEGCGCFELSGDTAIDSVDVEKFLLCASGPGLPDNVNCLP